MIIVENPEACTGCLICEMVCSFHHVRKFSRSQTVLYGEVYATSTNLEGIAGWLLSEKANMSVEKHSFLGDAFFHCFSKKEPF